jgi:hypothetical protein
VTKGALKSATIEFGMNVDETDTDGFVAVRTAFLGNSEIANVSVQDGDGNGLTGNMEVVGFNLDQPLANIQTVQVTMKPSGAMALAS